MASGDTVADEDSVLMVTPLRTAEQVDEVAGRIRELLEYEMTDLAELGQATFMAMAELCENAVEHGASERGAYVAARRFVEPRDHLAIAISDLGIGIPEHIRQRYPEWSDDSAAIALATQPHVSGTGESHRGNGFGETFEAALTSGLHAAQIEVHSANGFFRDDVVQEQHKPQGFPPARFKRGTWISYDLVPAR